MGSGDCSGYGTQKSDSDQATDGLLITKERTTYYLTTLNNSFSVSTINTSSIFIIQGAASAAKLSRISALLRKSPNKTDTFQITREIENMQMLNFLAD
jgi:hypothetical protein